MKTNLIYLSTLIFTINISEGQNNYARFDAIPVIISGDTLKNPWAGGFNSPQFSQIDLNGDGIKDLFAFERNWNGIVKTFLNGGTPDSVDYTYAPQYQSKFPKMYNWALLVDYNCDGKEDIFTSVSTGPAGITVYRNDYDSINGLKFTLITSRLYTQGMSGQVNLYVGSTDIPAIVDVDNDGDIDVLTFGSSGTTVEYHRNYSMENYGNCDSLEYVLENQCWGNFAEDGLNNTITLGISCKTGKTDFDSNYHGIHSGSTILALDIDGDVDKEVVLGDISSSNMVLLINGGTPTSASMTAQDPNFPSNITQVNLNIFPAGFHLDVNNDGVKDLLVAPNNPNSSENFTSIWYYENTGIISNQPFEYRKNNFLQDEMIEVGSGANPVFFDYNADGLLDIIIGNYGYYNTSNFTGKLALYKNIGTQTNPAFELITSNFLDMPSLGLSSGLHPAFGDLDADGDEDMIIGDWDGLLHYFENTAGAGNPANFVLSQPTYKNIDVGQFAAPQLIDINRDGKLDLLIGERSGTLNYFENIGTPTSPDFSSIATNDFFGGIDVMVACCTGHSTPYLFEDSTGSYAMFVGSEGGYVYYYGNIDGNLSGNFTLADSIYTGSFRVSVSGADINNDGKIELAVGEYPGGMAILKDIVLLPIPSGTTALTANTTATDATQGNCDGSATAIVSGGTSPYTYLWDDPNNQATQIAAGLCLGTYTVLVTDSIGDTATATVTINEITGIADIDFINYISIFPNPANTSIYLSLQGSHSQKPIQVNILNVLGQQVLFNIFSKECRDAINGVSTFFGKAKTNDNYKINIAGLSGGIYFVRILFNEQWITKKLIIQH